MCMNKSIMSPEFMSGALKKKKKKQFSSGAYRAAQTPAAIMARQ